jgi:hypothetical protein
MPPIGPATTLDLNRLAAVDPQAANLGYHLNLRAAGGVDLDGDPLRLRRDEFLGAVRPYLQRLGPNEALLVQRLDRAFQLGWAVVGEAAANPAAPPAGPGWQGALSVELPRGQPRPGPAIAHGGFTLRSRANQGQVTIAFPFPSARPHQRLAKRPPELLVVDAQGKAVDCVKGQEVRAVGGAGGERSMLHVTFELSKLPRPAFVRWSQEVTLTEHRLDLSTPVPLAKLAKPSAEARRWLKPAPMIQVEDPGIRAMAARIRGRSHSVQDLAKNTLREISALRRPWTGAETDFQNDAVSFLRTGLGECVAHANLFAALMRANQVPTRVVTGVSRGVGYAINMHYQNEYFVPGKGWAHVEPQGQEIQSSRVDMVHTGVVPPAMEQQGFGFESYAGIPMLSMLPQVVDAQGKPVTGPQAPVDITAGLAVQDAVNPHLGLHGA